MTGFLLGGFSHPTWYKKSRPRHGHIQQREEHWAIVDLKGKACHTRTIPMPAWVKEVLDQWIHAANISAGKVFRRVHKVGKAWGEKLTEKAGGTWFASMPRKPVLTS